MAALCHVYSTFGSRNNYCLMDTKTTETDRFLLRENGICDKMSYSVKKIRIDVHFIKRIPGMKVSYNKLWKILIDKKMNKSDLREMTKMGPNTMAKLGRDETISMDVLLRICEALNCDVGDIMEVLPDEDGEGDEQ